LASTALVLRTSEAGDRAEIARPLTAQVSRSRARPPAVSRSSRSARTDSTRPPAGTAGAPLENYCTNNQNAEELQKLFEQENNKK